MRPQQWTKNLVIFAALIFSKHLFVLPDLLNTVGAFVLFCFVSGSLYIFNDISDIEKDKLHPRKRKRPIAAGELAVGTASTMAAIFLSVSMVLSFLLSPVFGANLAAYAVIVTSYTYFLKRVVILDVILIATGFVLRATSGAMLIRVDFSPWLIICTFLLALFLAIAKRRNEILVLERQGTMSDHRRVLRDYSLPLIDQMTAVTSASTLIAYALYTFDERTVKVFGTSSLGFTIPFVIYGIFRYLYLVHQKEEGGSPEMVLLTDRGILLNVLLWIASACAIIYIG